MLKRIFFSNVLFFLFNIDVLGMECGKYIDDDVSNPELMKYVRVLERESEKVDQKKWIIDFNKVVSHIVYDLGMYKFNYDPKSKETNQSIFDELKEELNELVLSYALRADVDQEYLKILEEIVSYPQIQLVPKETLYNALYAIDRIHDALASSKKK